MAYVIAYILNILGIMDFLGYWLGPIMGIFGLPGQSFVILLTTCCLVLQGRCGSRPSMHQASSMENM